MKIHKLYQFFSALLIVFLCVSLFTACQRFERIEASQVERIVVWTHLVEECELNEDDSAKFIELFNSSKYEGKESDFGTTPEFGIYIYVRDGTYLYVTDFPCGGMDFEVSLHDSDRNEKEHYFITNEELYAFVLELTELYRAKDTSCP